METKIKSVSEYFEWIKKHRISEGDLAFEQSNVYYRGHSDATWILQPSVFRKPKMMEFTAIQTATNRLYKIVRDFSYLERLIYFQHYGLYTRLLDVTKNPLVALYFACSDETRKDICGCVHYGYCNNDQSLFWAELIAELASTVDSNVPRVFSVDWVKNVLKKRNIETKEPDTLGNALCFPHFVDAPYNSDRIINQQGAFLIAPVLEEYCNDKSCKYRWREDYIFKRGVDGLFGEDRIIIEPSNKDEILEELEYLNVNEAFVYPDAEHILKNIRKQSTYKINIDL